MKRPRDLRPAWAAIDLDTLAANARRLSRQGPRLRAVLKADAYGHGAAGVGARLAEEGIDRFAVALVEEGAELRGSGLEGDILVMGPCDPDRHDSLARHDLVVTISGPGQLRAWSEWRSDGRPQPVHLKVNTGMNRLGLPPHEAGEALRVIREHPDLDLVGLMSHYASADEPGEGSSGRQAALFRELTGLLDDDERRELEVHIANSAGLLHAEAGPSNVGRPGLALFGYDPGRRVGDLEPVMTVAARISQVQRVEAGERVGYGGRWIAERTGRIGIVPVGYADGFPWRLGDRSEALVEGLRVPVVGAVSMDMLALDLTETGADEGSEVVLLGRQGQERIDGFELADRAGTVIYEVLCGFGLRLPRVYTASGRRPWTVSRFQPTAPRTDPGIPGAMDSDIAGPDAQDRGDDSPTTGSARSR